MVQGPADAPGAVVDDFVEAFEMAQARCGQSNLGDFLPDASHPLFRAVLGELIRVDLEYSWARGWPKHVEDYRQFFPHLENDRATLTSIAFEEYRLRRQAGECPSPAEYQQRLGLTLPQ